MIRTKDHCANKKNQIDWTDKRQNDMIEDGDMFVGWADEHFDHTETPVRDQEKDAVVNEGLVLVFLSCERAKVSHQVGFQRITRQAVDQGLCLKGPEKVIDFNVSPLNYKDILAVLASFTVFLH